MSMVFTLASFAKEWLDKMFVQYMDENKQAVEKKALEDEEVR